MALQLLQGDMRGRQRLVGGTLAGTHRGPDAGVSEEAQAAVEGSQVAVHRMPVPWVLLAGLVEGVVMWHGCLLLTHTAEQTRVLQKHVLHSHCWQA